MECTGSRQGVFEPPLEVVSVVAGVKDDEQQDHYLDQGALIRANALTVSQVGFLTNPATPKLHQPHVLRRGSFYQRGMFLPGQHPLEFH